MDHYLGEFENPILLWRNLSKHLFAQGINTELHDISATCFWKNLPEVSYFDIGYEREGNKLKRLVRTYLSESEIEKFNRKRLEILKKKKNFVLLFRFGNQEKKSKVGDFCIVAATFIFINGTLKRIHIFYRTTECVTKFLADIVFLDSLFTNVLFLDMTEVTVKFLFTKVYVKYFHFLNYVRISKKILGEDPTNESEKGRRLVAEVLEGKKLKYSAGKKIAKRFRKESTST